MAKGSEDPMGICVGKYGKRTSKKDRVVTTLMCFIGTLIGALFALVPILLLFPDLLDICIFGGTCGKVSSTGLDCVLDSSDPLCIQLFHEKCKSSVWDAHGDCCEIGIVDKCGICGGTATEIDNQGLCCSGSLDASKSCCYDVVNSWGVCGGGESSGSVSFSLLVGKDILEHIPKLLSILLGIDETKVYILQEASVDFSDESQRNLLGENSCSKESSYCVSLSSTFEGQNRSINAWWNATFIIRHAQEDSNVEDSNLNLDTVDNALSKLRGCYCEWFTSTSEVLPHPECGNSICECECTKHLQSTSAPWSCIPWHEGHETCTNCLKSIGEVCINDALENCCINDCDVVLKECPSNTNEEFILSGSEAFWLVMHIVLEEVLCPQDKPKYPVCGGKGVCVPLSGKCECWSGYSGDVCQECKPGYMYIDDLETCIEKPSTTLEVHQPRANESSSTSTSSANGMPPSPPYSELSPDQNNPPEGLPSPASAIPSPPTQPNASDSELNSPLSPPLQPPTPPLPPLLWREVGRLARDLGFEYGPSLAFHLEFDAYDNTPYLGFQDLGEPEQLGRPSIVYFDGKNWVITQSRGAPCQTGSSPLAIVRYTFDYKVRRIDDNVKMFVGSFDFTKHMARFYMYDSETDFYTKIRNNNVNYFSMVAETGSRVLWDNLTDPIFITSNDVKHTTHVQKYNFKDNEWTDMEFGAYISGLRDIIFVRNIYNDQLYASGCLAPWRSDMYPMVYRFEEYTMKWENISKYTDNENAHALEWYTNFCDLSFDGFGQPISVYVSTKNNQNSAIVMKYNEQNENWDDVLEIVKNDLPNTQNHFKIFWDGVRFAMDHKRNIYLYFRTHYFSGVSWPMIDVDAKLWILKLDKYNISSWSIWNEDLDHLYGTYPIFNTDQSLDSTLGHFTFDPRGVPYYAFCKDSFDAKPLCPDQPATYEFCGRTVPSRCAPSVFRLWNWK